jgi:small subunit ribosomal protein S1
VSEIPRHRQGLLRQAAGSGAAVDVMIVGIDADKRRIALALAPEDAAPGDVMESRVAVGAVLTGVVERLEPYGVFVRLGPGQTGLIPTAELGTERGTDHRRMFSVGKEVTAAVVAIEEGGRRIRLSRVQALAQAEQAETQAYQRESARRSDGFGLTLGERIEQARKR